MLKHIKENFLSYECICCGYTVGKSNSLFCSKCEEELKNILHDDNHEIISCFDYSSDAVKELVITMKNYKIKEVYKFSAKHIADKLKAKNIKDLDAYKIAFAPRSALSLLKSGFDQSYEIGKYLSHELFGTKNRCIVLFGRSIFSKQQKFLNSSQRRDNANDNLYILPFTKTPDNLIILDDITTTGSTLFALRELASENGAKNIILCTVAKQKLPNRA